MERTRLSINVASWERTYKPGEACKLGKERAVMPGRRITMVIYGSAQGLHGSSFCFWKYPLLFNIIGKERLGYLDEFFYRGRSSLQRTDTESHDPVSLFLELLDENVFRQEMLLHT